MCEPPRKWMRLTSSMVSGVTCSMSPCMIHSKPSRMPTTSTPSSRPRMVAALMTLLMPGAGPPPTRIARLLRWVTKFLQSDCAMVVSLWQPVLPAGGSADCLKLSRHDVMGYEVDIPDSAASHSAPPEAAVPERAASHEAPAASSFLYLISARG